MDTLPTAAEIRTAIVDIRGMRVVLDSDLAAFYGQSVSAFNQAVSRNAEKFDGYRFQLSPEETHALQSQNVISKSTKPGGRRKPHWVYNDYGVVIAGTLFRGERAIKITRMMTEAFVDGAALTSKGSANVPEIIDPEMEKRQKARALASLGKDELLDMADTIINKGKQGFIDWVSARTTERQMAVAETMKVLMETTGQELQNEQLRVRLGIAKRLEAGDYTDDEHRRTLLELLKEL